MVQPVAQYSHLVLVGGLAVELHTYTADNLFLFREIGNRYFLGFRRHSIITSV